MKTAPKSLDEDGRHRLHGALHAGRGRARYGAREEVLEGRSEGSEVD